MSEKRFRRILRNDSFVKVSTRISRFRLESIAFYGRTVKALRARRAAMTVFLCCATAACAPLSQRQQAWKPLTSAMEQPATGQMPMVTPPQLNLESVGTPPNPAASVSLAAPFVGCWQGAIKGADSIVPIGFFSLTLPTQSYRICYLLNSSNNRTYSMELREVLVNGGELIPTEFENQVVWSDSDSAYLRTHIASNATQWLLFIPIHYREEVYADESVTLENPNLFRMRGVELIKVDNSDYARAAFHTDFSRVPKPSP